MKIPTYKLVNIRYTKVLDNYDPSDPNNSFWKISERTVIPTFVPHRSFKAVDVSELSDEERTEMLALLEEYHAYYDERAKTIFNFEDWIEHTHGKKLKVKWRTFKLDNTELLD